MTKFFGLWKMMAKDVNEWYDGKGRLEVTLAFTGFPLLFYNHRTQLTRDTHMCGYTKLAMNG